LFDQSEKRTQLDLLAVLSVISTTELLTEHVLKRSQEQTDADLLRGPVTPMVSTGKPSYGRSYLTESPSPLTNTKEYSGILTSLSKGT